MFVTLGSTRLKTDVPYASVTSWKNKKFKSKSDPTIFSKDCGSSTTPSLSLSENANLISLVDSYPSSNLIVSEISKE
jgi:hypothetical protein